MGLLHLGAKSDTFSVNNSSSGGSRDLLTISCLNFTKSEQYVGGAILVSGLVCFVLLTLSLSFEIFYICRYKTTFLQRLFFYFTIAAAIIEVTQVQVAVAHVLCNYILDPMLLMAMDEYLMIPQFHAYFVELLLIGSISVTLLSKMYKHRASRQAPDPNTEYMLCCCAHKTSREIIFCLIVFIATLILPLLQIAITKIFEDLARREPLSTNFFIAILTIALLPSLLFIAVILDMVLTVITIIVLISWFCKLRRRNLLPNRMKLVCREISLVVGFMAAFLVVLALVVLLMSLAPAGLYSNIAYGVYSKSDYDFIWINILFPFLHCFAPLMFFVYIWTSPRVGRLQRKAQGRENATAPSSTRKSLPSNTSAHAPNFLSPSTAGPTEDTPLLGNNTIQ